MKRKITRKSTPKTVTPTAQPSPFQKWGYGSYYDGANVQYSRRTGWRNMPVADSQLTLTDSTRISLMAVSRWLYANTYLGGILDTHASYCTDGGWTARYVGEDHERGEKYEAWFNNWANICDISGRKSFSEFLKLAVLETLRDGDAFIAFVKGESGYPLLQSVGAHRIGRETEEDEGVVGGVVVNRYGRPRYYRVCTRNYNDNSSNAYSEDEYTDIPANSIHQFVYHRYADQVRGVTVMARGAKLAMDVGDLVDFESIAVKLQSAIAVIKQADSDEPNPFAVTTQEAVANGALPLQQYAAGAIPVLPKGYEIQPFQHNRPGNNFNNFVEQLNHWVLTGAEISPEFMMKPDVSGPAIRFIMAKHQRSVKSIQGVLDKFARKAWAYATSRARELGQLPPLKDWYAVEFSRPRALSIDIGRESAAKLEELAAGATNLKQLYDELNLDWQEQLRQRARELQYVNQLAEEYGVEGKDISSPRAAPQPPKEKEE